MQDITTTYRTVRFSPFSLIILVLMGFSVLCTAQNHYKGPYSINQTLHGLADFEFYIKDTDTIKNGKFKFESNLKASGEERVEFIFYSGQYSNGKKSGNWVYRHHQLKPGASATIVNSKLVQEVSGSEFIVSGSFKQGIPDGPWIALSRNVQNSIITDTVTFVSAEFKSGNIYGAFKGKTPEITIEGQYTADGYPNGSWRMIHPSDQDEQLIEFRNFDGGFFSGHYFDYKGQREEVLYAGMSFNSTGQNDLIEVPFDSAQLEHLQYLLISPVEEDENPIPEYLCHENLISALNYSNAMISSLSKSLVTYRNQNIWHAKNEAVKFNLGKLLVIENEWDENLITSLAMARRKCEETQKVISNFFENPNIEVGIHSNSDLKYYSSVFEIYSANLQKFQEAIDILSINSFQHVNLFEAIDLILAAPEFPDSVYYYFRNEKFTRPYFKPVESKNQHPILYLQQNISQLNKEAIIMEEKVAGIVAQYQKQGQLADAEALLVAKRDSIIMYYRNEHNFDDYNKFHQELSDSVINLVGTFFEEYAGLSLENKVNAIEQTTNCFNQYLLLYKQVCRIPLRIADIDNLFTRIVWNPYTYTDMNERVKERLYRIYETRLLPLIWSELKQNIHCDVVGAYALNYEKVYQRMLQLREQDTRELEKELKKASSIPEVLSLLSLSLVISDK